MGQAKKAPAPYHRGNVREDLLKAAFKLLETERFEDISARRLCREIGVTSANFYNHFPSFNHLMHALAATGFEMRAAQNLRILSLGLPREEALIQMAQTMVDFAVDRSELFRIMFGQVAPIEDMPELSQKADKAFALLVQIVYGADIYRPDDVAWSHANCKLAYSFFAFAYGLARLVSLGQFEFPSGTKAERRKFVEDATRGFIHGLPPLDEAAAPGKIVALSAAQPPGRKPRK